MYPFQHISLRQFFFLQLLWLFLTGLCSTVSLAQPVNIIEPVAPSGATVRMKWSDDGKFLASASSDGQILVWELASGRLYAILEGHTKIITSLIWLKDGQHLLSSSTDKTIRIWNTLTGNCEKKLDAHQDEIRGMAISPDGQQLISWSKDLYLSCWSLPALEKRWSIKAHSWYIQQACWSPDGSKILSGAGDKTATVWEASSGKSLHQIKAHTDIVSSVAWTPEFLFTASTDGSVKCWNTRDYSIKNQWKNPVKTGSPELQYTDSLLLIRTLNNTRLIRLKDLTETALQNGQYTLHASGKFLSDGAFTWQPGKTPVQLETQGNTFAPHPQSPILALASGAGGIDLLELQQGRKLYRFQGYTSPITVALRHPNNHEIVCAYKNGELRRFDLRYYSWSGGFQAHTSEIVSMSFSSDGKKLITVSRQNEVVIREYPSLAPVKSLIPHDETINSAILDPEAQWVFTASDDNSILITPLNGKDKSIRLVGHNSPVLKLTLSPDGKTLYSAGLDGKIFEWNWKKSQMKETPYLHYGTIQLLHISQDGKTLISQGSDRLLKVWDLQKRQLVKAVADIDLALMQNESPVTFHRSGKIAQILLNGKPEWELQAAADEIPVAFDPEKQRVFCRRNGSLLIYDLNRQEKIGWTLAFGQEHILLDRDFFYAATPGAARLLSWKQDGILRSFEEIDRNKNRPDILCRNLGHCEPELTSMYIKAIVKRNGTEDILPVTKPEARINWDKTYDLIQNGTLNLEFSVHGNTAGIASWNVLINGNPVFGQKGKKGKPKSRENLPVKLSAGANRIQVRLEWTDGSEAHSPILLLYANRPEQGKIIFVGIGVSKYREEIHNLRYADSDIRKLEEHFSTGTTPIEKIVLLNEDATRHNILKIRESLRKKCGPDDQIILVLSGHGLLSRDLDFYFAAHDADFKKPEKNGVSYQEILGLLDSLPAQKKLILMDACHSGEVDKGESTWGQGTSPSQIQESRKGIEEGDETLITPESFHLMQEMFNKLGKGNGITVLSAASGNEFAYEGGAWKGGVFTWFVLEGLHSRKADLNADGKISLEELLNFVSDNVYKSTDGRQKPCSREVNYMLTWDF